jgi:hypothetical protein
MQEIQRGQGLLRHLREALQAVLDDHQIGQGQLVLEAPVAVQDLRDIRRGEGVDDMEEPLGAGEALADGVPGLFPHRVHVAEGDLGGRNPLRAEDLRQAVEAGVRHGGQAADAGLGVHLPAADASHDLEQRALPALGKPDDPDFHCLLPSKLSEAPRTLRQAQGDKQRGHGELSLS